MGGNDPTTCWHQLHPRYRVLQQGKCLSCPPECVGGVTEGAAPRRGELVSVIREQMRGHAAWGRGKAVQYYTYISNCCYLGNATLQ